MYLLSRPGPPGDGCWLAAGALGVSGLHGFLLFGGFAAFGMLGKRMAIGLADPLGYVLACRSGLRLPSLGVVGRTGRWRYPIFIICGRTRVVVIMRRLAPWRVQQGHLMPEMGRHQSPTNTLAGKLRCKPKLVIWTT